MNIEELSEFHNININVVQSIYEDIRNSIVEECAEVAQDAAAKQRILDHYKLGRIKKLQYLKQQILQGFNS